MRSFVSNVMHSEVPDASADPRPRDIPESWSTGFRFPCNPWAHRSIVSVASG